MYSRFQVDDAQLIMFCYYQVPLYLPGSKKLTSSYPRSDISRAYPAYGRTSDTRIVGTLARPV